MKRHALAAFALSALFTAAPLAALTTDTSAALEQIVTNAQRVRAEAQDIRQRLRAKAPDFTDVHQRMSTLQTHADTLKQSFSAFDVAGAQFTEPQKAAFERARGATDVMHVLLANKTNMLADAAENTRNRTSLGAQAESIAKRAEMVQQQVARIRG